MQLAKLAALSALAVLLSSCTERSAELRPLGSPAAWLKQQQNK